MSSEALEVLPAEMPKDEYTYEVARDTAAAWAIPILAQTQESGTFIVSAEADDIAKKMHLDDQNSAMNR